MATAHRSMNDLPTIRCSVGLRERHPVLLTQAFIGADALGEEQITDLSMLTMFGIAAGRVRVRQALMDQIATSGDHPIARQIALLDDETDPGLPLWLQIGQDSAEAALLPWEKTIVQLTGRGTLRIPNFLKDPFAPGDRLKIAICATAPRASGAWDLHGEVTFFLRALRSALETEPGPVEVGLFLPAEWPDRLTRSYVARNDHRFRVAIAPRPDRPLPSPPRRSMRSDADVTNPWLRWMQDHYAETGVDAVHFICPGYAAGDQGALALAQSPADNGDAGGARFVGQTELTRFLANVGAAITGFTAIGAASWSEAIHRLAYQLSWARPGAIYVTQARSGDAGLPWLLRGIYTELGLDTSAPSTSPAYAYPQILPQAVDTSESDPDTGFSAPHPEAEMQLQFSRRHRRSPGAAAGLPPHAPVAATRPGSIFKSMGLPPEPERTTAQIQLSQRHIAAERARVSSVKTRTSIEQAQDSGTKNALDFLEALMRE